MASGKMQTEEETAAAEEPILEEGSGREQVRKDIFWISSVPLYEHASVCASGEHKSCAYLAPTRTTLCVHCSFPNKSIISTSRLLNPGVFIDKTCIYCC